MTILANQGKRINTILHITAWTIIIIIPLYLSNVFNGGGDQHRLYEFYIRGFSAAIIFYLNYLWLVPGYFLQNKKAKYAIIITGIIIINYFLSTYFIDNFIHISAEEQRIREAMLKIIEQNKESIPPMPPISAFKFFNHLLVSVLISGFALGLGVMEKLKENEEKQKELEKEKLNSELAFLKNQVSPHFFFNTLNNIYSLIGINTEEAQNAVLKLSKLMRYLLYESEQGESKLNDEINFMTHYIDLMKLRLSDKVKLSVSFPETAISTSVPPLLFIPFIENAFKHGISYREHSFIDIQMTVSDNQISFQTRNSIGTSSQSGDGQHSGIGLENVKKRLNLLFPNAHDLQIQQMPNVFSVQLRLDLKTTKQ